MPIERTIRYSGKEVTILWKPHLCIHSRRCWLGLPEVFKPGQRPWVIPDAAAGERITAQVAQCPSGALSMAPVEDQGSRTSDDDVDAPTNTSRPETSVEVTANGPLIVKGTIEVRHADGRVELKEERCALCRCGASGNKPWCDGSHRKSGFAG
jgi:uncharacterized Fe-S cluster protein YjdI